MSHAAKFASEDSSFVGPVQTITQVLPFGRPDSGVNYGAQESRVYFEAERARAIPDDVLGAIESSIGYGWSYFP